MQTFLPFADYEASAKVLDYRRLGKQRAEAKQCLIAQLCPHYRWRNHKCSKIWRGYPRALAEYGIAICREWMSRDYQENTSLRFFQAWHDLLPGPTKYPPWLGYEPFHHAQRSNLVRKLPSFYGPKFEAGIPSDLPYLWLAQLAHLYSDPLPA